MTNLTEGAALMRDLDSEALDGTRRYSYEIDGRVRNMLLERWKHQINATGPTLELGAHTGSMSEEILRFSSDLTAVEGAASLIPSLEARLAGRATVVHSTFDNFSGRKKFANIFLVHTLEHVDDPIGLLQKMTSLLIPGGRAFVAVPNAHALSRQIACRMGLMESTLDVLDNEFAQGHRRTYSLELLQSHARAAGYSHIQLGGVLVKPLANFQLDAALNSGIVSAGYLDALNDLSEVFPDLSSSIYAVLGTS
jgi:SAM-dependent methyltransferase